jgi:hypothetical protein
MRRTGVQARTGLGQCMHGEGSVPGCEVVEGDRVTSGAWGGALLSHIWCRSDVVAACLQTMDGATSLWIACQRGHEAVACLLLDRGADVNQALVRWLLGRGTGTTAAPVGRDICLAYGTCFSTLAIMGSSWTAPPPYSPPVSTTTWPWCPCCWIEVLPWIAQWYDTIGLLWSFVVAQAGQ